MLDWSVVNGQIRHVLTAGAGALVADGVISNTQGEIYVAVLMFAIGSIWSIVNKQLHKADLANAAPAKSRPF